MDKDGRKNVILDEMDNDGWKRMGGFYSELASI